MLLINQFYNLWSYRYDPIATGKTGLLATLEIIKYIFYPTCLWIDILCVSKTFVSPIIGWERSSYCTAWTVVITDSGLLSQLTTGKRFYLQKFHYTAVMKDMSNIIGQNYLSFDCIDFCLSIFSFTMASRASIFQRLYSRATKKQHGANRKHVVRQAIVK